MTHTYTYTHAYSHMMQSIPAAGGVFLSWVFPQLSQLYTLDFRARNSSSPKQQSQSQHKTSAKRHMRHNLNWTHSTHTHLAQISFIFKTAIALFGAPWDIFAPVSGEICFMQIIRSYVTAGGVWVLGFIFSSITIATHYMNRLSGTSFSARTMINLYIPNSTRLTDFIWGGWKVVRIVIEFGQVHVWC